MTKCERAEDFLICTSFAAALLAVIYSFILFSVALDWGIFLFVTGFVFLFFLGFVMLVPRD